MRKSVIVLWLLLSRALCLYADQFRIVDERYEVEGRTKTEALIRAIGRPEGRVFATKEALEAYVDRRKQQIDNLRVFQSFDISTEYGEASELEPDSIPVVLTIHIKDGTRFLPLPYGMYNSNQGFMAGVIATLPNVGGYLQDFQITGVYNAYPDRDNGLQWDNPNFQLMFDWMGFKTGRFIFGGTLLAARENEQVIDRGKTYLEAQSLLLYANARGSYRILDTLTDTLQVTVTGMPQTETLKVVDPHYYLYGQQKMTLRIADTLTYDNVNWRQNFRQGI